MKLDYNLIMDDSQAKVDAFNDLIDCHYDEEPENEMSKRHENWEVQLEKIETMRDLFQQIVDECEYNIAEG